MNRSFGHRAPLLWLVLPMIAGLAAGRAGISAPWGWLLLGATAATLLSIVACYHDAISWLWGPSLVVAMALCGLASYELHRMWLTGWDHFAVREARLNLAVDRLFTPKDTRKTSGLATVTLADDHLRALIGQHVYFSLNLRPSESAPLRSEIIAAVGLIGPLPREPTMDSFDGYLFNRGINFKLTRGRIVREVQAASAYQKFCARAAERLSNLLGIGVAKKRPEFTSVLRAMMLGQQSDLSDEQNQLFMHSGTMHIFSISGLHIAVIAGGLHAVLSVLRISRMIQFIPSLVALWLYVDISGAAPSAIRAFAMVAFLQTAFLLQRPTNPVASLALSALVVLLLTPLQLFSASFQMSYGIVAALLLFGLPLAENWQAQWSPFRQLPPATWRWWHHGLAEAWRWFSTAGAIGVASALTGAVSGVLFFKLLTPGAILVNFALIPLSSLVILAGFVSLLTGLLGGAMLASLFNHAAVLVLWLVDWLVRAFLKLPGMWFDAHFNSSWMGSLAAALLMITLLAGYFLRWEKRYGGFWPPVIVVALTLMLAVKF